jgi:hypothetical protein
MKFKVTMKCTNKTLSKTFLVEEDEKNIILSSDDEFIKNIVSQSIKEFGRSPDKMSVVATLEL